MVWRVWFRTYDGTERYFDVEAATSPQAIFEAHELVRSTPPGWRYWWMDRWQPLVAWAGTEPPRLRRRLVLAWRRIRRGSGSPTRRGDAGRSAPS